MFDTQNKSKLRVAFMGNFSFEKGSEVFVELVRQAKAENLPIEWYIFGGIGDEDAYRQARRYAPIKTTGFYTNQELPKLLESNHIDVGLILSIFPESYSKLTRECWQVGLPLIFNRIGVLETFSFTNLGIDDLPESIDVVVRQLDLLSHDPKLLDEERHKIKGALKDHSLVSANDKHRQYFELYFSYPN